MAALPGPRRGRVASTRPLVFSSHQAAWIDPVAALPVEIGGAQARVPRRGGRRAEVAPVAGPWSTPLMASPPRTRAAILASSLLLATPAAAQDPPAPPPPAPPADAPAAPAAPAAPVARPLSQQPNAMQSPGPKRGGKRPPPPPRHHKGKRGRAALAPDGAPIVAAPTFHKLDDGSTRIAVEVGTKVDVGTNHPQGRLVFRLKNAFVLEPVNLLPVITTYFATPVDRAQLAQVGPDVDLVIDLREGTTPTHRVVETPRGIVLQVDFPRVARADNNGTELPGDSSGVRAKRRASGQSLGVDRGDGN